MASDAVVLDKRFQLGKVLGRGPSGVVHLATDLSRGSTCVVKRIHAKYSNRNILDRVQALSHAAADMMHPVVLGVLYTGYEPSGTLYLVSPFIDGESLKARLARGPLSLTATLAMLEPLCSALQAAAERDLAHGALHPSNVFFPTEGGVLLSDFGMAELRVSAGAKWDGLLSYVAPESLETGAAPATVRADVFSLGVLVYECLIGQPMFDAKSLASYLAMVGTPPKMTVKHPSYAHLDAVLEMAAQADPEARFATVQALWRALQSALLDLPASLANNLTRGMAPSAQRTVSPSKPPQARKPGSKPSAPPHPPSGALAPPATAPRPESGSNPPARPVQAMPQLLIEEEIEAPEPLEPSGALVAPARPQPTKVPPKAQLPVTQKLPEPLPPPPVSAKAAATVPVGPVPVAAPKPALAAARPTAAKAAHRPVAAMAPIPFGDDAAGAAATGVRAPGPPRPQRLDPQQILPTDPSYRLRTPPPSKLGAMAPLFWATIGGIVVGGSMIGVQYYSRLSARPQAVHSAATTIDTEGLLRQAETESLSRNYASAFAYTDLILRTQPSHTAGKAVAEQASEQLRVSAVYGAFLRAADREQSDLAVALYRELPPGSPFRSQAWDPFMKVRNSFVRRRLAVATAALTASECDGIREQIEKLYFISDSATDSALQQGQRLLGKCKSGQGTDAIAEAHIERSDKTDKPEKTAKADKAAKAEKTDKPELVAVNDAGETEKKKKRKAKDKPSTDKPSDGAAKPKEEPKESLPSALRNPF